MIQKTSIPLVRLNLILPFLNELDRRGLSTDIVLAENGLVRNTVFDSSVFVPSIVVHRFLEDAARTAKDPHFAVCVGETLDWSEWPPMIEAASNAHNLVGFLVRFIEAASSDASSAKHHLNISTDFSVFSERRTTEQEISPAQNDAFTAAYVLGILKRAAGPVWEAEKVRLTVCDVSAMPSRYQGVHIIGGDRMGIAVRFPSQWLLEPFNREEFLRSHLNGQQGKDTPRRFQDALRHLIATHLNDPELSAAMVAGWIGISTQSLQRRLRASETTLSGVIREIKKDRAVEYLISTRLSVGEIASMLGFDNPTSFTRAFKNWTGLPPREYRKRHRNN